MTLLTTTKLLQIAKDTARREMWGVKKDPEAALKRAAYEGARVALEELGIGRVVSGRWACPLTDEGACTLLQGECGGVDDRPNDCPLKKGAVLVEAQK